MQLFNSNRARVCLFALAAVWPCASQTINGGYYTFADGNAVQLSSIVGTAKVNTITLTNPPGVCGKIGVGVSSSMSVNGGSGNTAGQWVTKFLFPTACNGPIATSPSVGLIEDSWTLKDFLYNADGIDPTDYWVQASYGGLQLKWKTITTGTAATKVLHPYAPNAGYPPEGGLVYSGGTGGYTIGSGVSRFEFGVIPGGTWKVQICVAGSNYQNSCFYDLWPLYYLSNGNASVPTASSFVLESKGVNTLTTNLVQYSPGTNGSGTALETVWVYQ